MYDAQYCTSTAFKFNIRPEIMQTMQKLMKEQKEMQRERAKLKMDRE